jgi:putative sigma-54 modulation protein
MELQVKTHNLKLSDEVRGYIEKRVGKLDRINERISEAKFELREEPHHANPNERIIAQFTIATRRAILRAEEKSSDIHAAVDLVTDKMARQIRRFHDRKIHRHRRDAVNLGQLSADLVDGEMEVEPEDVIVTSNGVAIVRTKRFPVQPMDTEEAIEQIELLGHDFFVYFNAETSQMNVLYRRKSGDYGVLEPELA